MKKCILLISALLVSAFAFAERVSRTAAEHLASEFLKTGKALVPVTTSGMRIPGRNTPAAEPEFYIFNRPEGGWVIVAADDIVQPVLAYSETGSFPSSRLAPGLEDWMDEVNQTVIGLRESGYEADERVRGMWNRFRTPDYAPKYESKVLETASWDQDDPYNMYCPVIAGDLENASTGCVATAMGIVMRFNRWPGNGNGVIGGYTSAVAGNKKTYIPSYSIDDHYYDWDNMPLTDGAAKSSKWTAAQKMEVATLLHDCGVMVNMQYSKGGSGAFTPDVAEALVRNMSYSENISVQQRAMYSPGEWFRLLRGEVDNGRVVLYSGNGDVGGHAFVCDGYSTSDNLLHINWGWGGKGNGFFTMELRLNEDAALDSHHIAIVGLAPAGDPNVTKFEQRVVGVFGEDYPGLSFMADHMGPGGNLTFLAGIITVTGHEEFRTALKVCLMDADGVEKEQVSKEFPILISPSDLVGYYIDGSLKSDPLFTDCFQLFFKKPDGSWAPVTLDRMVLEDGGFVTCGVTSDPLIITGGSYSEGDILELKLSKGDTPVVSVEWTFDGMECEGGQVRLHAGVNVIQAFARLSNNDTVVITKRITIN